MIQSGNFALLQACTYGHVSVMDKLLQSGADVNAQNEVWTTPLFQYYVVFLPIR